ncbi:hypothetical protein [Methanolobus sp. ZRKC5]|uniref:hypothetical protein n=1 Tax=unclassified Methanolobus TaxID=2629569 RepID=UPI00313D6633
MTFADIKKRMGAIEQKHSRGKFKAFVNIDHELDEEIEQYKQEHPHHKIVIINVVAPNDKDDDIYDKGE